MVQRNGHQCMEGRNAVCIRRIHLLRFPRDIHSRTYIFEVQHNDSALHIRDTLDGIRVHQLENRKRNLEYSIISSLRSSYLVHSHSHARNLGGIHRCWAQRNSHYRIGHRMGRTSVLPIDGIHPDTLARNSTPSCFLKYYSITVLGKCRQIGHL